MKRALLILTVIVSLPFCDLVKARTTNDTINIVDSVFDNKVASVDRIEPIHIMPEDPDLPPVTPPSPKPSHDDTPQTKTYSVGTPNGTFSVGNLGAANYQVQIDMPNGGKLMPQIGVAYNSQAGYGLVGHGFNITGLSVITRRAKDVFHDKTRGAITYNKGDNYALDGKRLILVEGNPGEHGAVYSVEGDPFTKVTVCGTDGYNTLWFEVKKSDGLTYKYGETSDSKLTYKTPQGKEHIQSWYLCSVENHYHDYMNISYATSNLVVRPVSITYGLNKNKSRGITNKITFSYKQSIEKLFALDGLTGKYNMLLSDITTATDNHVYRKYSFVYDTTSDESIGKCARLVQIDESNDAGQSLAPIKFDWKFLERPYITPKIIEVNTQDDDTDIKEESKSFAAIDINNDGISDIVRASTFETNGFIKSMIYICLSHKNKDNSVSYDLPRKFCVQGLMMSSLESFIQNPMVVDFDGDGYNDLLIPQFMNDYLDKDAKIKCEIWVVLGRDVVKKPLYDYPDYPDNARSFGVYSESSNICPLFATMDADADGRDNYVLLERQEDSNGFYNGNICSYYSDCNLSKNTKFQVRLTNDPTRLFTADYNDDGLTDLLIMTAGGSEIYFNNGGTNVAEIFSESNSVFDTKLNDKFRIAQGDFNGDGRLDFVYSDENSLSLALNNGNGTFTYKEKTSDIELGNQSTNKDNDKFSLIPYDIDHDGKTDVAVVKANYKHHGGFRAKNVYKNTVAKWLCSTGESFREVKSATTYRCDDAYERNVFTGDFDGDGFAELANFGMDFTGTIATSSDKEKIHIYNSSNTCSPDAGKVVAITDGLGNNTKISYANSSNPSVYTRRILGTYPINTYTLPMPLVASVTESGNGIPASTTNYKYSDLKIHLAGGGMLGFTSTSTESNGVTTENKITRWNDKYLIPVETQTTTKIDNQQSTVISTISVAEKSGGNYFAYNSKKDITDLDGNKAENITVYDTDKGVVTEETVRNDGDDMYKTVKYSGYIQEAGVWLPTRVEKIQKHSDDAKPFTLVTDFTYNYYGDVLTQTEGSNTHLPLKTTNTYDWWGNVITSVTSGYGIKENIKSNVYDATGRYVVKSSESGSDAINSFTYDMWGNVLTESDETDPSNILTTKHIRDGWGVETKTVSPDEQETEYTTDWANDNNGKYYVEVKPNNGAPVKTWYNSIGKESRKETVAEDNAKIIKETKYEFDGQISTVDNDIAGNIATNEAYFYDKRRRQIEHAPSPGRSQLYTYGNRITTINEEGRTYTRKTDAWGNIIEATDPKGTVSYKYNSNGKPCSITSNGATVVFEYDDAGNQISMTDPDAGTIKYEYSADGKVLSEIDAKGIETKNEYDAIGRLTSSKIGKYTVFNTYGTSGNEKMRLVKSEMGNNSVEYTHDKYGRVVTEKRNIEGKGSFAFGYEYNSKGQLAKKTYPGGLVVTYQYDKNGYNTQVKVGDDIIYELTKYAGDITSSSFKGNIITTKNISSVGLLENQQLKKKDGTIIENLDYDFDFNLGNLNYRTRNNVQEDFEYDDLDRLVSVSADNKTTMSMKYADNGNISYKTGVGNYHYSADDKPHAVMSVDNEDNAFSKSTLSTLFNDLNKIDEINDSESKYKMTFSYGPDNQRWLTNLTQNGKQIRQTVYAEDYEQITENGVTRDFYYLDGNTIIIKQGGTFKEYQAFTDYLGSIIAVVDENGNKVFDASYDVWGKQTVALNTIGLHRGYCGHEMLDEFAIINMNGRIYDPVLGRFFSPDNYVQQTDNSQNYNRYSYCLNNPLKYTDPSGEVFYILIGAAIGGVFNFGYEFVNGKVDNIGSGLKAFGIGALAGAVGSATGCGLSGFLKIGGCISGALCGAIGGVVSNGVLSAGNQSAFGDDCLPASSYIVAGLSGAVIGGVLSGFDAVYHGRNFWTGKAPAYGRSLYALKNKPVMPQNKVSDVNLEGHGMHKITPYDKGQMGVDMATEQIKEDGGTILGKEVTIKYEDGTRVRIDIVSQNKDGMIELWEIKNGLHAGFTPNQKSVYPKMLSKKGTFMPIGRNAQNVRFKGWNVGKPYKGDYNLNIKHYYK